MENPYNAPAADFVQSIDGAATYEPAFASLHGRIGRARYLAYTILPWILLMIASVILGMFARRIPIADMLFWLLYIPVLGLLFVMSIRRLNDMNLSGWLSLLGLIPIINLLLWVGLMAAPGTDGPNRHGPAPGGNTTAVLIAAWAGPILVVLSFGYIAFKFLSIDQKF